VPTFDQLVKRVRRELKGFTLDQESVSELAAPMDADDTSFTVDTATADRVSRGLVEIDDELILVKSVDQTSGQATVLGLTNGRGREGTTPASHSANALVTSAPAFPRQAIKDAINDAITGLYPSLEVFATEDFAYNASQVEYSLPAATRGVWYVVGRWVGPEKVSAPMPNWRYNPQAYSTDFPTGKSIQLFDGVTPGQNVRVVYTKAPSTLSANADDFATVTGYADRVADLVIWDACKRLLPGVLTARLQQTSVESTERAQLVSTRDIQQAVQTYAALYAEGLQRERDRQFAETPNYATFQGS
jgi:hypothetical protein